MNCENMATSIYVGAELVPEHQAIIDTIIADQKPNKIISFVNADFADDEDMPGGLVMLHALNNSVHVDSIPQEAFQYVVACEVLPTKAWSDADFTGPEKEAALNEAIPQFSRNPPGLKLGDSKKDDKVWSAELGSADGFAGIYKQVQGGTGRETQHKYYVVAQAGAPVASEELRQKLIKHPETTFHDLLHDPDYNHAHYVAQRNAQRLAFNVAHALKVPIRHMSDVGSFLETPYSAYPMRAVSNLVWSTSSIEEVKSQVGVFHKVRPAAEVGKQCLVSAGPYEGLVLFNMRGLGPKKHLLGLPACTGRSEVANTNAAVDYKTRSKGIIWEGKTLDNPVHPDLHPEAFKPIDDAFLASMKDMGWNESGLNTKTFLIPLCVKIFNPAIRRK